MTELQKSKPKRGKRQRTFAVDFVSPLQLEECLHRIKNLPETHRLKIIIEDSAADSASFSAELFRGTHLLIRYRGKMQRWEGTNTRVTGEATMVSDVSLPALWVILCVFIILVFAVVYTISQMFMLSSIDGRSVTSVLFSCFTNVVSLVILMYFSLRYIGMLFSERQFRQTLKDILADKRKTKTVES